MINYNRLINDAVLDSQLCCNQTLLQLINVPHWLLINTFLHHSLYFVFHRTGVRTVGRPQVWFDKIRGFVSQQLNGLTHTVCWRVVHAGKCKKKVDVNVTDDRQQLFGQQDITIICTIHLRPSIHENQTNAPEPSSTVKHDELTHIICVVCYHVKRILRWFSVHESTKM